MKETLTMLFLQSDTGGSAVGAGVGMGIAVVYIAILVLIIAAMWKVFEKAGEPGWAAIVPIYNFIVLLKIAGKPVWWIILLLIPFVNFVILIIIALSLARNFGKGAGFAIGLLLLPFIFYPMLAWGDAQYQPVAV
ncbi:MAG TPA: DUF5684 domain-containing protein [Thermoanaerobaculia bacterium]|nr:DUF5684 domain-containing protein [Thermoanaerobaculia bacterium]